MEQVLAELGVREWDDTDAARRDIVVIVKTKNERELDIYKRKGHYSIEAIPLAFPYQMFGTYENELINVYNLDQLIKTIKKMDSLKKKPTIVLYDESEKGN